jgi:hypothetical protein
VADFPGFIVLVDQAKPIVSRHAPDESVAELCSQLDAVHARYELDGYEPAAV